MTKRIASGGNVWPEKSLVPHFNPLERTPATATKTSAGKATASTTKS